MRVLLILPPMTQLNAPYPATAFLTAFLRSRGVECRQADLAIELVSRLFSREGLEQVGAGLTGRAAAGWFAAIQPYLPTIDPALRFLRGQDPTLALRIAGRHFLPEGPRFRILAEMGEHESLSWAFGALGAQDQAKYLATLYLSDLSDLVRRFADAHFELSRYAEKLSLSAPTFAPLQRALRAKPTVVDRMLAELTEAALEQCKPDLVGITAPFPGNVYGAFRIAQTVKRLRPAARTVLGGGYPSTELRELKEPRVFDYFDYVVLDSGEAAMLRLVEHLRGERSAEQLRQSFVREGRRVAFKNDATSAPIPHRGLPAPTFDGLPLDRYLSVFDTLNPMHRIWSDGRWNKLMLAHGCYWSQCTFCDTRLDYIERYSPAPAEKLVDRMEAMIRETGQSGFHFVDEAAPPALLKALAERILARGLSVTWWGNIRFDKYFTPEVCGLLARSGCVAVTGGLEVADDRLLKLIRKGVSVEQVARVTRDFADAGIMVHAYLMYGYPSQTAQETVNALELVRQLFAAGCIQSGFWHRFALTCHSPIAADPKAFGITLLPEPRATFARNEIPYRDPVKCDHDRLGCGLRKALFNYMHGVGLDANVRTWFEGRVPRPAVPANFIARALRRRE
jgi:radical SAM superfamily enzyme YgiQ (UPF0313 family)